MAARRQEPGRTARPATSRRTGPSPARGKAAPRSTSSTTVRFVLASATIELPWPRPGTDRARELQRQAMRWTHVVRNRARWAGTASLAAQQDDNARAFLLDDLHLSEAQRKELADAGTIHVSIPYTAEQEGWEARILPWEFVLSAGTRDLRQGPLVISRSLERDRTPRPRAAYRKVLFVESAPGRLAQNWEFKEERSLVQHYTGTSSKGFERIESPTLAELEAKVRKFKPDIVHLAGFDTHQGLALLKEPGAEKAPDGYLLAGPGGAEGAPALALAEALTAGTAPSLIVCNIWNSAARIAPLLIAAGAGAAVGFQDSIDDALAEIFLGTFYRSLSEMQQNDSGFPWLETAFEEAWLELQAQPKSTQGTGIVLWRDGAAKEKARPAVAARVATTRFESVRSPDTVKLGDAAELFAITAKPQSQFTYGLLHNDRDVFENFVIRNLTGARVAGVQVLVELHSNEGTYPYRRSFNIDGPVLDVVPFVRIALTSNLARTLDEVIRTSLYLRVTWGQHEIYSDTFWVTMAPIDQWTDTDLDRVFLPSFIFPRDSAVRTVIKNAEQFVTTLRDDPTAGFDGYQSLDPELANPALYVDSQVQALWYSVVYRVPISYINPPPTYAIASQRIRTPSEIVGGGFGTCIDLALMFAACLEAVEIYPVIFILKDHAFPGYWRTDAARDEFLDRIAELAPNSDDDDDGDGDDDDAGNSADAVKGRGTAATRKASAPWCFGKAVLPEILAAIERNELVPLESVDLTARSSFSTAGTDGRWYFLKTQQRRFLMMLDIQSARELDVTPLPLGPRTQ